MEGAKQAVGSRQLGVDVGRGGRYARDIGHAGIRGKDIVALGAFFLRVSLRLSEPRHARLKDGRLCMGLICGHRGRWLRLRSR